MTHHIPTSRYHSRRSLAPLTVVLLLVSVVAAACGSSSDSSGQQGISGKKILIGFATPKTGPTVAYDQDTQAMIAYFKTVNAAGGVGGYKYTWKQVDNQGSIQGGATAARSLLAAKTFALVNIRTSSFLGAVQVLKTNPDIPVFSLASGAAIKSSGLKNAFGLYTDYTEEAQFGTEHLIKAVGAKKIGLVYDPTLDPDGPAAIKSRASESGGELSRILEVTAETTNYAPIVQKMKDANVDAVYIDATLPSLSGYLKAAKAQGVKLPVGTFSGNLDPQLFGLVGDAANGIYVNSLYPPLDGDDPELASFKAGTDKYAPTAFTGQGENGWAGGIVFNEAVKRAVAKDKDLTWDTFYNALYSLSGEKIGFAKIAYSKDSHAAIGDEASFKVYQVENNKFVKTDYNN